MFNPKNPIRLLKIAGFVFLIILVFAFFLFNWKSFFYSQDEYYHFWFLNNLSFWQIFTKPEGTHYFPLTLLFQWLQYKLFGLSLYPRIIITLTLHLTVLWSVVKLLKRLVVYRGLFSLLLLALFVGINPLNSQAYLWMSTYSGTLPSIIFFLWSIIFFLKYEEKKERKKLYLSLIFLVVSLLFKEYSLIGFVLFPLMILRQKDKRAAAIMIGTGILFAAFRFLMQFIGGDKVFIQTAVTDKFNIFKMIDVVYAYLQILLKSFWQTILSFGAYKKIILVFQLPPNVNVDETAFNVINSLLFILGFFSLLVFFCLVHIFNKFREKNFQLALWFFLLSVVPFTILSPFYASSTYLEGRYYYLISIALLILASCFLSEILGGKKIKRYVFSIIVFFLLAINGYYYYDQVLTAKKISQERIKIINTIVDTVAKNQKGKNLIILTYGGKGGYSALEDLTIPFQAGLGNMLAVHLYDKKKFVTEEYFKNNDTVKLFDTNTKAGNVKSYGVYEFSGKKFGFFFNYDDLKKYIEENPSEIDSTFSFYWDKDLGQINDITSKTRIKLLAETTSQIFNKNLVLKYDISIIGNKNFFSVNFDKQFNKYTVDNKEIVVHRDDLEASYGGPYLDFSFPGDGEKEYTFPKSYEGYDLGFCMGVRVDGQIVDNEIFFDGDKFKIIFAKPVEKGKTIGIAFALNGKILVYSINHPVKYVLESKSISIKGDGSQRYKIKLSSLVKSLRSVYLNDIDRYQPHGLIDGKLTRLKGWGGYNTDTLDVELFEPLKKGQMLTVPLLTTSDLSGEEKIIFKYIL